MRAYLLPCLILIFPTLSHATKISPLATVALEFGGDTLVNVTYTDGSKSDVAAGRGFLLGGGAIFDFNEASKQTFEAQTTFGIKWTGTKQATNGEVDWIRWPIEALGFYHDKDHNFRVGGGLTIQVGNKLSGTQDASIVTTSFKNAAGLVMEGDWLFHDEAMALGLRATAIKYKADVGPTVSGNSLGMNFTYFWL